MILERYWSFLKTTMDVRPRWSVVLVKVSLTCIEGDRCLKRGDENLAQKIKVNLEEIQRRDKKLREQYVKQKKNNLHNTPPLLTIAVQNIY